MPKGTGGAVLNPQISDSNGIAMEVVGDQQYPLLGKISVQAHGILFPLMNIATSLLLYRLIFVQHQQLFLCCGAHYTQEIQQSGLIETQLIYLSYSFKYQSIKLQGN